VGGYATAANALYGAFPDGFDDHQAWVCSW